MRFPPTRHHSWHHSPPASKNGLLWGEDVKNTGSLERTSVSNPKSSKRHHFFFRSCVSTDDGLDSSSTGGSFRHVRFDLDDVISCESPYTEDMMEGQWYSPDEVRQMKHQCAREVAALWNHTPKEELAQVLEDCTRVEYEETPDTGVQRERLVVLNRLVGLTQYCTTESRQDRQRAVVAAVRGAQRRSRGSDLCQGFLVSRASEQVSLPCQRLAHWMAMAVAAMKDEDEIR